MNSTIRRLLFANDAQTFGGAERYVLDMAEAAAARGIEPSIWWLRRPGADQDAYDAPGRIADLTTADATPGPLGLLRDFVAILRTRRPHAIVINSSPRPWFWLTAWAAYYAGIPSVWVEHIVEGPDHRRLPPGWFRGRMEGPHFWRIRQSIRHRLGAAAASAVLASSEQDRDRLACRHAIGRQRILVVPPGINVHRYRYSLPARQQLRAGLGIDSRVQAAPFVVGTAARLVPRKRIECLIEAVALLRRRSLNVIGVIAGDGPERDRLAGRARELGVADAVHFLGATAEMAGFYPALDAFALCSETESFGLVLTEAMACERPVVATPTAGAGVQIRHLDNGWQLSGFTVAELADALAALYESPQLRERFGRQARSSVESSFSISQTLDRTLSALCACGADGQPDRASCLTSVAV